MPVGQVEAARACGMSGLLLFRRVVLPIAMRQALPAYGNELVLMVKATSLASIITLMEVTGIAHKIIAETYRGIEVFVCAGATYLIINFLLIRAVYAVEHGCRRICASPSRSTERRPRMNQQKQPVLSIRGLRKGFGALEVLKGISLTPRGRRDLDHRRVGLGQEHAAPLHQPAGGAGRRRYRDRRRDDRAAPQAGGGLGAGGPRADRPHPQPRSASCSRASICGPT